MGLSEIKKKKKLKTLVSRIKNLKAVEYLPTFQLHKSPLIISLALRNPKSQVFVFVFKKGIQRVEYTTSGTLVYV